MQGKLDTEALLENKGVNWTSIRPVYIYGVVLNHMYPGNCLAIDSAFIPGDLMKCGAEQVPSTTILLRNGSSTVSKRADQSQYLIVACRYDAYLSQVGRTQGSGYHPQFKKVRKFLLSDIKKLCLALLPGHSAGTCQGPCHCICEGPGQFEGLLSSLQHLWGALCHI